MNGKRVIFIATAILLSAACAHAGTLATQNVESGLGQRPISGAATSGPAAPGSKEKAPASGLCTVLELVLDPATGAMSGGGQTLRNENPAGKAPFVFTLPDAYCENFNYIYEVESEFVPEWSTTTLPPIPHELFGFCEKERLNYSGMLNYFSIMFWDPEDLMVDLRSGFAGASAGASCQVRKLVDITAGKPCRVKVRISAHDMTVWFNGDEYGASMAHPFLWVKGRKFIIGGETARGVPLNGEIKKFTLRICEQKIKISFAGGREFGYFTGEGPHQFALAFPDGNGAAFASTVCVKDIDRKAVATISPAGITGREHTYRLPSLPFGWYRIEATAGNTNIAWTIARSISIVKKVPDREPAEQSIYGICESILNSDPATTDALFYRMAQMGVRWYRTYIWWHQIEKAPGVRDFSALDRLLAIAKKHGIELYPCLLGGNLPFQTVPEDKRLTHSNLQLEWGAYLPSDLGLWKNYVAALVKHCRGKIKYYQVWNEADGPSYLQPATAENYAYLLRETAAVIRANDPNAVVGLSGFCGAWVPERIFQTSHRPDESFSLTEFYACKPQKDFDISDYHFYSMSAPRQSWDVIVPMIEQLQKFLAAQGDGHKPLWNSETTFESVGNPDLVGRKGDVLGVPCISDREQAIRLVQWHVQSRALDIRRNFWYRSRGKCGVINDDFSPKPVYVAHAVLADIMAGLTYDGTLALNPCIRAYRFSGQGWPSWFSGRARHLVAIWTTGARETVIVRPEKNGRDVHVTDMMGNRRKLDAPILTVGEEPLFIESQGMFNVNKSADLRLPLLLTTNEPFTVEIVLRNPLESDARFNVAVALDNAVKDKREIVVAGGGERTEKVKITGQGRRLVLEGVMSAGLVTNQFTIEKKITFKRSLILVKEQEARFEISDASQVKIGGVALDNQGRVISESKWKGVSDLSAQGIMRASGGVLHFDIRVTDDLIVPPARPNLPLWGADGIEIFVDLRTASEREQKTMEHVFQIAVGADGRTWAAREKMPPGFTAAVERLPEGYRIKGSFALPAGLSAFGFDIAVDDDDSGKGRKTQLVWSGEDDNYKKPDAYGVVIIKP